MIHCACALLFLSLIFGADAGSKGFPNDAAKLGLDALQALANGDLSLLDQLINDDAEILVSSISCEPINKTYFLERVGTYATNNAAFMILPTVDQAFGDGSGAVLTVNSAGIMLDGRHFSTNNVKLVVRTDEYGYINVWRTFVDGAGVDLSQQKEMQAFVGRLFKSLDDKSISEYAALLADDVNYQMYEFNNPVMTFNAKSMLALVESYFSSLVGPAYRYPGPVLTTCNFVFNSFTQLDVLKSSNGTSPVASAESHMMLIELNSALQAVNMEMYSSKTSYNVLNN